MHLGEKDACSGLEPWETMDGLIKGDGSQRCGRWGLGLAPYCCCTLSQASSAHRHWDLLCSHAIGPLQASAARPSWNNALLRLWRHPAGLQAWGRGEYSTAERWTTQDWSCMTCGDARQAVLSVSQRRDNNFLTTVTEPSPTNHTSHLSFCLPE